jgi:hypothetical protein
VDLYISLVILTILISGGIFLFAKYPAARKYLPFLRWFLRTVQITVDHWGFKRTYSDRIDWWVRYSNLIAVLSIEGTDLREARTRVGEFVADTYNKFYPPGMEREKAKHAAAAGYMAVLSFPEIRDTVDGLKDHENLDVRKATYVVIDILGELFDREDELSKEYFQHLVYGLNKCLRIFKKGGRSRKSLSEIYATLWRIYQLTKAFNKLKADKGLSKKEFYEKITFILDSMFRVLGEQ